LNIEKINKRKKEYLKEQQKAKKKLDVIHEEQGFEQMDAHSMVVNKAFHQNGTSIADKDMDKNMSIDLETSDRDDGDKDEAEMLNLNYSNRRDGQMTGLNSSLRSTNELQFTLRKKDMTDLKEDLSKDTTFVGYRGGSKQFVRNYKYINISGGAQSIHQGSETKTRP
jgi:hypothetical protein